MTEVVSLQPCLRFLLTEVMDYAGLFPPAKLTMAEAFSNYLGYQRHSAGWILGSFICPSSRLCELQPYLRGMSNGRSANLIAVCPQARNRAEFQSQLQAGLSQIDSFQRENADCAHLGLIELRLPSDLMLDSNSDDLPDLLDRCAVVVQSFDSLAVALFFEASVGRVWREKLPTILDNIAAHNNSACSSNPAARYRPAGFKIRCGGTADFETPSAEMLAFVISACRDRKLVLKATAGLHHPYPRFDERAQCWTHGFLNLLVAAVMAHNCALSEPELCSIIGDHVSRNFAFEQNTIRWKDISAELGKAAFSRKEALVSFGSCSFEDPVGELELLGLLPDAQAE